MKTSTALDIAIEVLQDESRKHYQAKVMFDSGFTSQEKRAKKWEKLNQTIEVLRELKILHEAMK